VNINGTVDYYFSCDCIELGDLYAQNGQKRHVLCESRMFFIL